MRNVKMTIWVMAMGVCLCVLPAFGSYLDLNDGGTYNISWQISDTVRVDYESPGIRTTVNFLVGGYILDGQDLKGYEDSYINISGGSVEDFFAWDNTHVNISDGSIEDLCVLDNTRVDFSGGAVGGLFAWGNSQIDFSGGSVYGLHGYENSQIDLSGGIIGSGLYSGLYVDDLSVLTIEGSDFTVDGEYVGYGQLYSIYGWPSDDEPPRHLTGILANGDLIDNDFYIGHDARIILVPEPATLLLLGLGAVVLRKRVIAL